MKAKELLVAISAKIGGDFDKYYDFIKKGEKLTKEDIELVKTIKDDVFLAIDKDYPNECKSMGKPPLVIYYQGDKTLLSVHHKKAFVLGKMSAKFLKGLVKKGYMLITIGSEQIKDSALKKNTILIETNKGNDEGYALKIREVPFLADCASTKDLVRACEIGAALSQATIIGEATIPLQITAADTAREMGNPIYVFPTLAGSPYANNKLIKNGACLIETEEDVA